MHLGPEAVRRQQQQLPIAERKLWRVMSIIKKGYAGLSVVSTQAWRQRFDAAHWGNGYTGESSYQFRRRRAGRAPRAVDVAKGRLEGVSRLRRSRF